MIRLICTWAQIAALHLRLPDLPDEMARAALKAEDRLIKISGRDDGLARGGWDPAKHPRTGAPPNRGWFAPAEDAGVPPSPIMVAQSEENERSLEEMLDPLAPARQALWDAAIARLGEIDPDNPNLRYFANPGSAPSQDALDRLNAIVKEAAIKRVTDKVRPGGMPIGLPGTSRDIRELRGDLTSAERFFQYLRVGGQTIDKPELDGTLVMLSGNAGYVTFRASSTSGPPAIDVNLPGILFMKIHFR